MIDNHPHTTYVDRKLLEIEKEMKVCQLCHDGYRQGIPLARLAKMHRPVSPSSLPPARTESTGNASVEQSRTAPLAGAAPSPKESLPLMLGASKVDKIVAGVLEDRGRRGKKPPLKKKYENIKKKQREAKGKQAGAKAS